MWKHLVGLTAAAPAFAEVALRPRVHPALGPAAVSGAYLSPRGAVSSAWRVGAAGSRERIKRRALGAWRAARLRGRLRNN